MFAKIIYWALTALFGLIGLTLIFSVPISGICYLLVAAIFAPPITETLREKFNITLSGKVKTLVTLLLFIGALIAPTYQAKNELVTLRAEQAAEEKNQKEIVLSEKLAKFKNEKEMIFASIREHSSNGNHTKALALSKEYEFVGDSDLVTVTEDVKRVQFEDKKKRETEKILTRLKTIPATNIETNRNLYQELITYHPSNSTYQSKFDKYNGLVKQKEEKIRREKEKKQKEYSQYISKYGEKPAQSKWDGSYRAVEKYLKATANDPSSIDISGCTEVYKNKTGWLVGCDFRGKNAFGGLVRNSNWFTIAHGQVINVESGDSYSR